MKKIIYTLSIVLGLGLSANAQIESLAGPRIGFVYISASPASTFLNGDIKLSDDFPLQDEYDNIAKGTLTSLYGWQFESRFADGGNVTGIVEWIVLVAGMEKGKFLPSVSSMVGTRTYSGLEFAVGPNLSMGGIAMVFGIGYNFRSGDLNMPVNIAFVPGRSGTSEGHSESDMGPDGEWNTADDVESYDYNVDYHSGNRFSITVGFNLSK